MSSVFALPLISTHLPALPIALPLLGAALALLLGDARRTQQQVLAGVICAALVLLAALAIAEADAGRTRVYLMSNWQAPFGIALMVDRLAALMLLLVAVVGSMSLWAAREHRGDHFVPLFLLQLMGLNGAFLTADLFNLFVFFEVLLAASYGLLLQSPDRTRTNASTHYVVINLTGSCLFLVGVSLLYGLTGTLNMADLSGRIAALPQGSQALAAIAGFVLVVVFSIKAAMLPLNFWLTATYRAPIPALAALFALMTKVGVIAIARVLTLILPADAAIGHQIAAMLLLVAPLTMLFSAFGAIAARELKTLIGWTVVASAGLLVTGLAIASAQSLAGALFYLIGSTLAAAALFLLASARGTWAWRGTLFFLLAAATVGLPPLPGFIGKATMLAAATAGNLGGAMLAWVFACVLVTSLLMVVAFARMGSRMLLKENIAFEGDLKGQFLPAAVLGGLLVAVTVFALPIQRYTERTAADLLDPRTTAQKVLGTTPAGKEAR